jgi:hypothetical protein
MLRLLRARESDFRKKEMPIVDLERSRRNRIGCAIRTGDFRGCFSLRMDEEVASQLVGLGIACNLPGLIDQYARLDKR